MIDVTLALVGVSGLLAAGGMGLLLAIQAQHTANALLELTAERKARAADAVAHEQERAGHLAEIARLLDEAGEGWDHARALSDELAVADLHDRARCEGFIPAPIGAPTNDPRWS